ncbi:MAG: sialidase family protein [Anaerolineae bacterium]
MMADTSDMQFATHVQIAQVDLPLSKLPKGCTVREDLGIVAYAGLDGHVVHRSPEPKTSLFETRATITPSGDYLLMFPEGKHYGKAEHKVNDMLAYRSSDKGQTWAGPRVAFDIDYNQHGFVPLIPQGAQRIYAFGTQPVWGMWTTQRGLGENAPIGYRFSDDDGNTWSEVRIIRPVNDPDFRGMCVMRMCETDAGAWILAPHEGDWSYRPLCTRLYVLRSEDQGKTWELLPHPRHGGWHCRSHNRMDEGRPISLGGGKVFMMARTPEGHLWSLRSLDDGKTWTEPEPTSLVHPDAPPMVCRLTDGVLVALHHNRYSDRNYNGLSRKPEIMKDRSEIWVATSADEGRTWSEPRFLFANALAETLEDPFRNFQCSYVDVFQDGDRLHLFVPHRWRQVLHLWIEIEDLWRLPTRMALGL